MIKWRRRDKEKLENYKDYEILKEMVMLLLLD
jgi:hypothetical protein